MTWLTLLNPAKLITSGIDAISGYQLKKKEKEIIKTQAEAKIALAKQSGATKIALSDTEWEAISVSKSDSTWKDEYVTLVITWPLIGILAGSLLNALFGNDLLLVGTLDGIERLIALGLDFGILMTIVVSAAVSIKAVDKIRK